MKFACALVSACAVGLASGCTFSVEPIGEPAPPAETPPPPASSAGTFTVNWLVAGSSDPFACRRWGATELEVVVYDITGAPVVRRLAPCGTFTLTVPLAPGTYSADVGLLGRGQGQASTSKTIHAVEVRQGTDLAVNLDFPPSSMR
jgi:hypothetical protein